MESLMHLHQNEIRDYIARAPKRIQFDGKQLVNNTGARFRWLEQLCRGTIDQRINRRAGVTFDWMYAPWKPDRAWKATNRWHRRQRIILNGRG
jgi:hypothetical protein